jgi:hypothetical protein
MNQKKATTHTLIPNRLTLYQRERSTVWQCAVNVGQKWHRVSTGERELKLTKTKAHDIYIEVQVKKEYKLAPVTRLFRDVAAFVVKRMREEYASGHGRVTFKDYIGAIDNILVPLLGKYKVDSINYEVLEKFEEQRIVKMGREPARSTVLTHNAALNRILTRRFIATGWCQERNPC